MKLTVDVNFFDAGEFVESQHPRGQPENAGEFAKGKGVGKSDTLAQAETIGGLKLVRLNGPSAEFVASATAAIEALPESHRALLRESGVEIRLTGLPIVLSAEQLPPYAKHLAGGGVGGYFRPKWQNEPGHVMVAQDYMLGGQLYEVKDVHRVVAHELGHAVDNALGQPSQTPRFEEKRQKSIKHLTNDEKEAAKYFLASPLETWAECYSATYSKSEDVWFGGMSQQKSQLLFGFAINTMNKLIAQGLETAKNAK